MLGERFGEKQLCWGSAQIFHNFRNSSKKFSEFCRKIFWEGGHNWILRVQMKIFYFFEGRNWRKNYFFRRKLHSYPFGTLREKDFPYFWWHGYGRLVNTSWYIFRRTFWQKGFFESSSDFHNFWNSSKIFSENWQETFSSVVTTAFCVPRWSFYLILEGENEGKFFFLKFRIAIIF